MKSDRTVPNGSGEDGIQLNRIPRSHRSDPRFALADSLLIGKFCSAAGAASGRDNLESKSNSLSESRLRRRQTVFTHNGKEERLRVSYAQEISLVVLLLRLREGLVWAAASTERKDAPG